MRNLLLRHLPAVVLPVALLLVLPAAAQDFSSRFPAGSITTREQSEAALEAARKEEARLDQEFAARDAECYRKFLVNDCRDAVRRERELARREVRRVELEAGDTRRLLDQQESEQRRAAQREHSEVRERQRDQRPGDAAQPPAAGSASKPLTDGETARNRAEHEAKQKAHAERLAREQAEAATRAQNAEAYRQKQADAAKRAADNEAERKLREERRARRAEEMKRKEAEREAIRQRAAEAAAGAAVR